jgi:polyisoprenoid-binding protein YceI
MKTLLLLPVTFALLALNQPAGQPAAGATFGDHDWVVDSGHSSVVFKVKHANAAFFKGTFDVITGNVSLDPTKPEAGSVSLVIPVDSVDSNDKKRDEHLKNADFFNSKENPEITFKSTKVQKKGDAFEVTGELTMAGKSKTTTIVVEKTGEGEFYGKRVGFGTTFTVKRSDFGMTYGIDKNALGDEVTLMIDLELIQPKK